MENVEKIIKDANQRVWGISLASIVMIALTTAILQIFHLMLP
ncbi:MAG: emp24/gp25L/p24 family protein [Pelosinus sp.]|nr:emp24/gp25L/p24 family protein [Pelosinus sp.]